MTKTELHKRMDDEYGSIPLTTRHSLWGHIIHGTPTGDFLWGVLGNDLRKACWHADEGNKRALVDIVKFLYSHAPMGCWGSYKAAQAWRERVEQTPDIKDIVGQDVLWLVAR